MRSLPAGVTRDWLEGWADAAWDSLEGMTVSDQQAHLVEEMGEQHPKWAEGYAAGLRRVMSLAKGDEAIARAVAGVGEEDEDEEEEEDAE